MEPKRQPETADDDEKPSDSGEIPEEVGGSNKPEPTRYGDWEVNGRCTDF